MISYCRVDIEKLENAYDFNGEYLFPLIDKNSVYKCVSILESDTTDGILRVIVDVDETNDYYYYIPREFLISIETLRDKAINQIIDED
jgi:hypothetical protein